MVKNIIIVILAVLCSVLAVSLYYEVRLEKQCREELFRASRRINPDQRTGEEERYLKKDVRKAIIDQFPALQKCYQQFVKTEPRVRVGKLVFSWTITGQGQVRAPEILRSPFNSPSFEQCVRRVVVFIDFPEPPLRKEQLVEHTFNFAD